MIRLNRDELRDKIYACWLGKNIGGTLGTPFEGQRKVHDIKGFNSEPGNPLPNDDLDLQLVWLAAVRREGGPNKIDAKVLGEYWMEYITPYWNEYGVCKGNMAHGLVAPMCGEYKNSWKHSNGAWIRTEIWATMFPANVEKAIYYAYQDSCVDHGVGEGTYAAIFVAALESAAFIVKDIRELINIGLSKIPETCRFYKYITTAVECYDNKKTWREAREIITDMTLADKELGWFQAPANVAYAVIGLLYGEGDFKQSLIIAVNCGDDTDCTGATVGSVLGILGGTKVVPKDWQEYIGDKIVTVAIGRGSLYDVPPTCTELTNRVIEQHKITGVNYTDGADEFTAEDIEAFKGRAFADMLGKRTEYFFEHDFTTSHVVVEYDHAPDIRPGGTIGVKLTIAKKLASQKHYCIRFLLPDGWKAEGNMNVDDNADRNGIPAVSEYVITAGEHVESKNRGVIEITCEGRAEVALIPLVFFG